MNSEFHAMLVGTVLFTMLLAVGDHATTNPLFQELTTKGIVLTGDTRAIVAAPTMADGLDEAAQQAVLGKIIGDRYPVSEFVRNAVVAPFVMKFPEVQGGRGADLWFVAYGDLNKLSGGVDVFEKFTAARGTDAKLHVLTAAELEARKLPNTSAGADKVTLPGEAEERFVYIAISILDRVELRHTTRCMLSRTEDSVVIASFVDRRFDTDKEYPNTYCRLVRSDTGETSKGPVEPYDGAGGYLKATRLAEPKGAILIEYHMVYSEPHDWFNGANLLQSKLPILLQSRVRAVRQDMR